jgi:phosphoribosylanthranilate isomerase
MSHKDTLRTGIKICGVSKPSDIEVLNAHGVDMAGFVFYKNSPRFVQDIIAPQLAAKCRPDMHRVALLVDPSDDDIDAALAAISPHYIQLHGHETPERVAEIKYRSYASLIKAMPIGDKSDLARAHDYADLVDMFLFDAKPPENAMPGGNGEAFDWTALSAYDESLPYLLAGGLSPDNVAAALKQTGAPMVDISSGVESAPGQKDEELIAAFVAAVRAHDGAPETQVQE